MANENGERATATMSDTSTPTDTTTRTSSGSPTGPQPGLAGTGTAATRWIGIAAMVMVAWLVAFGLGFSPADRDQEEAVRIL